MPNRAVLAAASLRAGEALQYKAGMIVSVLLHLVVLVIIPLLMRLVSSTACFERPPTFQLVAAPYSIRQLITTDQTKVIRRPAQKTVKKETARPVSNENGTPQEDLDELSSILEEIPVPTRVSAVGLFKYNWYLVQVKEKIERYWNPFIENKNDSVVVSFTIYGDGTISIPKVLKKSNSSTLDNLALYAVNQAAPFARLPPGVTGNKYEMICTLRPTGD